MLMSYQGIIAFMPGSDPLRVAANTEFLIRDSGGTDVQVMVSTDTGLQTRLTLETDSQGFFPDHFIEDVTVLTYSSTDGVYNFVRSTNTPIPGVGIMDAYVNTSGQLVFVKDNGEELEPVNLPGASAISTALIKRTVVETIDVNGLLSMAYVDGSGKLVLSTSATANSSDAFLTDRTNHKGEQPLASVTELLPTLAGKASTGYNGLPPGATITVRYQTSWPARPTTRTDLTVMWIGGTTQPPGVLVNDVWLKDGAVVPPSVTVPSAPASSSVTNPTPTTMTINWTAPTSAGSSPITGYTVAWGGWESEMFLSTTRSYALTGFTGGQTYNISIYAHSAAGRGAARVQTWTAPAAVVAPAPAGTNVNLLGLPSRVLAVYATGWGTQLDVTNGVHANYNLILPFQLSRSGTSGAVAWEYATPLNMPAARARGQRIVISCGGAGQGINFNTRSVSQAFVNSVVAQNTAWGGTLTSPAFDGVDFNTFEADAIPNYPEYYWMAMELKRLFGSNFIISSPPAPWRETDWNFCRQMLASGAMDYAAPQYYDGAPLSEYDTIAGTGRSSVTMWVNDIAAGDASKIVVGFGYNPGAANYSSLATIQQAWDTIEARHPAIRGAFLWSHTSDRDNGWPFATGTGPDIKTTGPN